MNLKFNVNEMKEYTKKEKLPFILHWNLTDFCNLKCSHCCVPKHPIFFEKDEALKLIDFIKEKGFFLITLSGGECMLHPDFKEIYMALKRAGMYINIFTNGTTLTDDKKELFKQYPPRKVEVSVYGIDEQTFFETTGCRNGYSSFLETLQFLKDNNIRTVVKSPITTKNANWLHRYISLANEYNAEYKFGTFVFPMLDGDKKPLEERLNYIDAVDIEFSDEKSLYGFADRVNSKGKYAEPFSNKCSACTNSFTVNADASFSFCGMMTEPRFAFDKGIENAFNNVLEYKEKVISMYDNGPCKACKFANACPGCPGHLLLETGDYITCNEYFKNITKRKLNYLQDKGLLNDPSFLSEYF